MNKEKVTKKDTVKKSAASKDSALKKTSVKKTARPAAVKRAVSKAAKSDAVKAVKKTATKKISENKIATKKISPKKVVARKRTGKAVVAAESDPTMDIVKKCWKALDDKKADDIKILDVRGKSPITNYFIIATATSEPHMRALANELEKTLKDLGVTAVGRDYNPGSGWVVVDGFDFMAHIFLPDQRGLYGIEHMWKDADIVRF